MDFLAKSDMKRFGSLLAELESPYTCGVDGYPITLTSSFDMIVNYRDPSKYRTSACNANEDRLSFFNDQGELHEQRISQGRGHGGRSGGGRGGHGGCGQINRGGQGRGQCSKQGSNFYQALDDDDDYQPNESADVEDNPNEKSVPCSYRVESHIHYSPLKPFDTKPPQHWLMLDSCSTLNPISNKSWLSDIHKVESAMHIPSTGGL